MSTLNVDKVDPSTGTALELGTSGDTITVPTGAGLTVVDEVKTNKISPATGVAFALGDSGDTFTVPSGATIVNSGTATGFGGGKLGQVVSTTLTTTFSTSASSFTDITGLSLSITPVAVSSKIWVCTYLSWSEDDGNFFGWGRMMRDSTPIAIGTGSMGSRIPSSFPLCASFNLGTGDHALVASGQVLDSPSSTSAITYKVQGYGTSSYVLFINRTGDDDDNASTGRYASTITAMEILA